MAESSWYRFDNGSTLSHAGSEGGVIVFDEEHPLGARVTLERDTKAAPFAITCGIYGCMLHTRFFGLESEASSEYGLMKNALSDLLFRAGESGDDSDRVLMEGVEEFVETYP